MSQLLSSVDFTHLCFSNANVFFFYSLSVGFGLMVRQKKPFDKLNKGFRKLWLFKKENLFPTMFLTKKIHKLINDDNC